MFAHTPHFLAAAFLLMASAYSQNDKTLLRRGNEAFNKGEYAAAADLYSRSREKNPDNPSAGFNLGAALYRMGNNDSVRHVLQEVLKQNPSKELAAKTWHNLGNSYLAERKPREAIEAYKNALKLNPRDEDTRYNLAYAQRMIPPPQNQNQNQDEKNNNNSNSKDPKQQQENQEKSQENNPTDRNNQSQQQKPQMSPEEAEKMLQALMNKEKQNERDMKEKTKRSVSPSGKDW